MTRIVGAFAPWVMGALSLYRLQATVLDFNAASAQVLLANGFVEEGTQRHAVFKRGRLHDLRTFARTRATLHDADCTSFLAVETAPAAARRKIARIGRSTCKKRVCQNG